MYRSTIVIDDDMDNNIEQDTEHDVTVLFSTKSIPRSPPIQPKHVVCAKAAPGQTDAKDTTNKNKAETRVDKGSVDADPAATVAIMTRVTTTSATVTTDAGGTKGTLPKIECEACLNPGKFFAEGNIFAGHSNACPFSEDNWYQS